MRIEPYGENGIRILFGDQIDVDILRQVRAYYSFLKSLGMRGTLSLQNQTGQAYASKASRYISEKAPIEALSLKRSYQARFRCPEMACPSSRFTSG